MKCTIYTTHKNRVDKYQAQELLRQEDYESMTKSRTDEKLMLRKKEHVSQGANQITKDKNG